MLSTVSWVVDRIVPSLRLSLALLVLTSSADVSNFFVWPCGPRRFFYLFFSSPIPFTSHQHLL